MVRVDHQPRIRFAVLPFPSELVVSVLAVVALGVEVEEGYIIERRGFLAGLAAIALAPVRFLFGPAFADRLLLGRREKPVCAWVLYKPADDFPDIEIRQFRSRFEVWCDGAQWTFCDWLGAYRGHSARWRGGIDFRIDKCESSLLNVYWYYLAESPAGDKTVEQWQERIVEARKNKPVGWYMQATTNPDFVTTCLPTTFPASLPIL